MCRIYIFSWDPYRCTYFWFCSVSWMFPSIKSFLHGGGKNKGQRMWVPWWRPSSQHSTQTMKCCYVVVPTESDYTTNQLPKFISLHSPSLPLKICTSKTVVWGQQSSLEMGVDLGLTLLTKNGCMMPRGLVFSYTSFDRSERSVNSNDGVVRTISTTEFDSCVR